MKYVGLNNHPSERTRVTYPVVWWDDAFTGEELTKVIEQSRVDLDQATTLGGGIERRVSNIKFHGLTPEKAWFFERLNNVATLLNNQFFGMELNGYETYQYTEYKGEVAGKYDWHMDMCMGLDWLPDNMIEPRKLSLTLLLNEPGVDFEGGEFQVNLGNEQEARTIDLPRGRIIAFPSWVIHRVKSVTKGVRISVVVWITGPKFV